MTGVAEPGHASLVAIEAIKALKADYFWALDRKDWEAFAEVFTADAVMDLREERGSHVGAPTEASESDAVYVGREAILRRVRSAIGSARTVHQGHMPHIEITGRSSATGRWALYDWLDFGDRSFHGFGHYHEEYRCVGGRWHIARLELSRLRGDWR